MTNNVLDSFSLQGRNALITGAGKPDGLCFAIASAFHEAGANVALLDMSPDVDILAKQLGGRGYRVNLTDRAETIAVFERAVNDFSGRLDILFNGAGLVDQVASVSIEPALWDKVMEINLNSMFFLSRMAARIMIAQKHGRIINMASVNAYNASTQIPAYAASKGAVVCLTKELSNEWCEHNVTVNAIAPGFMVTSMTEHLKADKEKYEVITSRIPMKRWGNPSDLAGAAVFLASDASRYVSGTTLIVDGGFVGF